MADREQQYETTLEEVEACGGERQPKSKRIGLSKSVTHFLELSMKRPEGIEKKAQYKQREMEAEMRGFYKAQETLREIIAVAGTDAIADLANVRTEDQQRPIVMAGMRTWIG